jgi:RNA polymerase-binding transcription factor DksA
VQMHFASQQLQEVLRALERMKEGKYGHCEVCGWPIPPERLQAVPEATRCVQCSSNRQSNRVVLLLPRRHQVPDLYIG